jgi:hypothetical protein
VNKFSEDALDDFYNMRMGMKVIYNLEHLERRVIKILSHDLNIDSIKKLNI